MAHGVVATHPDESLTDIATRMRSNGVSAVAIMEDERLVGIITERDLMRAVADGLNPRGTLASAYMTASPHTIAPSEDASEAAHTMVERGVRHLPVVEEGRVVGFVSARDLLQLGKSLRADLAALAYEPW
jgi:CBS domain-containing protein